MWVCSTVVVCWFGWGGALPPLQPPLGRGGGGPWWMRFGFVDIIVVGIESIRGAVGDVASNGGWEGWKELRLSDRKRPRSRQCRG